MQKLNIFFILVLASGFFRDANAQLVFEWAHGIGESVNDQGNEIGNCIKADADGNTYMTGYFSGTVDFDPGPGTANIKAPGFESIFIARYDAHGNYVWAKGIGGSSADHGNSLCLDPFGNVYIMGDFSGTVDFDPGPDTVNLVFPNGPNIFITKYDADGNFKWAKGIGATGGEIPNDIAADRSGNIYLTGSFLYSVDFDPGIDTAYLFAPSGARNIFVAKYDSGGNYLWAHGPGANDSDAGYALQVDTDENVYVTGFFMGTVDFDPGPGNAFLTAGYIDIFLVSYDSGGNYRWAHVFGNPDFPNASYSFGLNVDHKGSVYITGVFTKTVDFDPGPGSAVLTSSGEEDIFIAKYDKNGNNIWAKGLGGDDSDYSLSISFDSTNNIYLGGQFWGIADFDPGAGTVNLSAVDGYDIFIAKFDNSCNLLWAQSMGGPGWESCSSLALDGFANIYVTGYFADTIDFDPGPDTVNLSAEIFYNDLFIAKYSQGGSICEVPVGSAVSNITSSSAKLNWDYAQNAGGYKIRYKVAGTDTWTPTFSIDNVKTLTNLLPATEYAWQVKSICDVEPIVSSEWSEKKFFTTDFLKLGAEEADLFEVYPNPVFSNAVIQFHLKCTSHVLIELFSVNGEKLATVVNDQFPEGNHGLILDRKDISDGIYFLQFKTSSSILTKKVVME